MVTYRWNGAHPYRDHANERTVGPGEALPADIAERVAAAHPHDVERVDEDAGDEADGDAGDGVAEPPLDPSEFSVDALREALSEGDYDDAELDAIAAAERAGDGDPRTTALDAIDAARSS